MRWWEGFAHFGRGLSHDIDFSLKLANIGRAITLTEGAVEKRPVEAPLIRVTTAWEYRAALSRVRMLEDAPADTAAGLERASLELAISRFLSEPCIPNGTSSTLQTGHAKMQDVSDPSNPKA